MFKHYKALLIDCDGTFVLNAEDIHKECVASTMRSVHERNGVPFGENHFDHVWQEQLGRGIGNFYLAYTASVPELKSKLTGNPAERAKNFEADYEACYKSQLHNNLVIRYGLAPLVKAAKREGLSVAIVSNARQSILEHTFACCGMGDDLDLILGSDTVEAAGYKMKPDGGPYIYACQLLNVDPRDTVGFEDSISGYKSLVNAGVGFRVYCQNSLSDAFDLRAAGNDIPQPHLTLSPQMCAQQYIMQHMDRGENAPFLQEPCILPPPHLTSGPQLQPPL
jgi:beta-phosphoglucomutase-like phosphatase (HAD superfamily)